MYLKCHEDQTTYNTINIVAADSATPVSEPDTVSAFAWYDQQALHTAPVAINLLDNAIASHVLGNDDVSINTYNFPLPKNAQDKANSLATSATGFNLGLFLIFAAGAFMGSLALFVVHERITKAKHIQFVSGVNYAVFWVGHFLFDFGIAVLPGLGILIVFAAFNVPAFQGANLGIVFLLWMLFAFAAIPVVYVLSFLFATSASAYSKMFTFSNLAGIVLITAVFVMSIPSLDVVEEGKIVKTVFLVFPNFAFGQALLDMFNNYNLVEICTESVQATAACAFQDIAYTTNYLDMKSPGVGLPCVFMFGTGVVFFLLLILIEKGLVTRGSPKYGGNNAAHSRAEDEDVREERQRVERGQAEKDQIIVRDLTKVFRKKQANGKYLTAVDHLSFGIPMGECFGLLGVNGAGKTTTFRMMTGDVGVTEGNVTAAGFPLSKQMAAARRKMGYCPQYDALLDLMTGRELLQMYARLRGIAEANVPLVVNVSHASSSPRGPQSRRSSFSLPGPVCGRGAD